MTHHYLSLRHHALSCWLALLALMLPTLSMADDEIFSYYLNSKKNTYMVSLATSGTAPEKLVIPSTYNDLPVTTIGSFKGELNLKKVTIPASITNIGMNAFKGCTNLTKVEFEEIPSTSTETRWILSGAFSETGLGYLKIPEGYNEIGGIKDNPNLTVLDLPSTTTSAANITGNKNLQLVYIRNNTKPVLNPYTNLNEDSEFGDRTRFVVPDDMVEKYIEWYSLTPEYKKAHLQGMTPKAVGDIVYEDGAYFVGRVTNVANHELCIPAGGMVDLGNWDVNAFAAAFISGLGATLDEMSELWDLTDITGTKWTATSVEPCLFRAHPHAESAYLPTKAKSLPKWLLANDLEGKSFCNVSFILVPEECETLETLALYSPQMTGIGGLGNKLLADDGKTVRSADGKTVLYAVNKDTLFIPTGVTTIAPYACYRNSSPVVQLPESLKEIGEKAFYDTTTDHFIAYGPKPTVGTDALTSGCYGRPVFYVFSEHLSGYEAESTTSFKDYALETIEPEKLTGFEWTADNIKYKITNGAKYVAAIIGYDADAELGDVVVPDNITIPHMGKTADIKTVAGSAFEDCQTISSISLPYSMEKIGHSAFKGSSLSKFTYRKNYALSKLAEIGEHAFQETQLTEIELPYSIENIWADAFSDCEKLTAVSWPSKCKKMKEGMFRNCINLKRIDGLKDMEEFDKHPFSGCTSLKSLHINNTTAPKARALTDSEEFYANTTLYVPAKARAAFAADNEWGKFMNIRPDYQDAIFESNNLNFRVSDYEGLKAEVYDATGRTSLGSELPATVTYKGQTYSVVGIGGNGLRYSSQSGAVTTFTISHDIDYIDDYAFSGQQLTSLPDLTHVRRLGKGAFYSCKDLTTATVPYQVKEMGSDVFGGCSSLTTLVIEAPIAELAGVWTKTSELTSLTLPSSLKRVTVSAINADKLAKLHLRATTPPEVTTELVASLSERGTTLYVPTGTKTAYQASNWRALTIVEETVPAEYITLDETAKTQAWTVGQLYHVTLKRSALSSRLWNGFCVPFDIPAEEIAEKFGAKTNVYEYSGYYSNAFHFTSVKSIRAGVPCIVTPGNNTVNFTGMTFNSRYLTAADGNTNVASSGYTYRGIYSPETIGASDRFFSGKVAALAAAAPGSSSAKRQGFSAYLRRNDDAAKESSIDANEPIEVFFDGVSTGLMTISAEGNLTAEPTRVYSIDGRYLGDKTEGLPAGIYVVNGQKMVVK